MKKIFVRGWLAGVGLAMGVGSAWAQGDARRATVAHLHGQARVSSDHVTWHKLEKGSEVGAGTLVQTAENATLDLTLSGGAFDATGKGETERVRLSGTTVLGFDKLSAGDVELDLQTGTMTGSAGKVAAGAKYEIKFSSGIVAIRGGKFQVSANGLVRSFAGEAVVATAAADGSTLVKLVTAGNQFDPTTGTVSDVASTPAATAPAPAEQPKVAAPSTPTPATTPGATPSYIMPEAGRPLRKF